MKTNCITFLLVIVGQALADNHRIEIVGKPAVHRVLQQTRTFLGGDAEIVARVKVTDMNGRAVAATRVILYARATDGPVVRLRAYGVTGPDGIASPRAIFDIPTVSLHATLQACLLEPADECSPLLDVDLNKRVDIELHYENVESTAVGTATYIVNGKAQNVGVVESVSVNQVRPRAVFGLLESVHGSRYSSVALFGEAAVTFSQLDGFISRNGATSLNFGKVAFGATAQVASRIQLEASIAPALGGTPGYVNGMAMYVQPIGSRNKLLLGASGFRPLISSSISPHQASLFAPRAEFSRTFRAQEQSLSGWYEYQSLGTALFATSSGSLARQTPSRAPAFGVDWEFHHGGPVFLSFSVYTVGVGTPLPYVGASMGVTLRNFVPRLP